ncbi:hypothetical protein JVT61DRAFT_5386 [Boletus reticuloceps]|uniref:F-box domain-containing protein n=1 Tax=Boletus reticuloceps TaxID=495285 RepID=A0A8I3AG03_9AGAM|nr:hypothetical protein JVT61DRAFT_5386 [Boletus reticuloceps]
MIPYLDELPPEIYDGILTHVPRGERQQTTLSLTRAIPRSPVPLRHLFECIRLKSAESVVHLYCRLRGRLEEPRWVNGFSLETWSVDADVVVNLVNLLPRLSRITLFVGSDFAPEHMEEILEKPREALSYISLLCREQLIISFSRWEGSACTGVLVANSGKQGAYFDTALVALARWPTANYPTLSIVQDPLDAEMAHKHHFAQPLVFFRLDAIHTLACSPYLRSLTNLRLRIPSRQVASFIYSSPRSIPGLQILDLSTCNVRLTDVEALAARFQQLTHLIIDECNITRGDAEGEWSNVGKICALATVKAAKEREKKLKAWLEARAVRSSPDPEVATVPEEEVTPARRARPGRRGLAIATISLRDPPTRMTMPVIRTNIVVPKVRIVPSSPTLRSLSATTSALHKDKHDAIRAQFKRGWEEGLAQLTATRSRLSQSWRNGTRMMRIAGDQGVEEGFDGLEDVDGEGAFYGRDAIRNPWPVPVLCLAGAGPNSVQHVDRCGHAAASCVYDI